MSKESTTLLRIKKALSVCGTSISDVLSEYDNTSTGIISSNQLQRALTSCGIHLTKQELQSIEIGFKYENGISIPALIAAVDMAVSQTDVNLRPEVFADLIATEKKLKIQHQSIHDVIRNYDRQNRGYITPQDFVRAMGATPEAQRIANAFLDTETGLINYRDICQSLKTAINSSVPAPPIVMPKFVKSLILTINKRGIDLRQNFDNYDKVRNGKIPTATFAMIITSVCGVQMLVQEMKEITQYYYDGNGLVDYLRFLKDINSALHQAKIDKQAKSQEVKPIQSYDVNSIMARIKEKAADRRIMLPEIFPRTRSGTISRYVFTTILNQANLGLSVQEIEAIASYFAQPNNEVAHQKFISYFIQKRSEKVFTDINKLLKKIALYLSANRMNLQAILLPYDRDKTGVLPLVQFLLAVQNAGINLDSDEINEICRNFPGNYASTVNMRAFCNVICPMVKFEQIAPKPVIINKRIVPSEKTPTPNNQIMESLIKISFIVKQKKIQLFEEFRSNDKLHHGTVPKMVFDNFVSTFNSCCTENQFNLIYYHYSQNSDGFDYMSFCRDILHCISNEGTGQTNENESPSFVQTLRRIKALLIYKMVEINDLFLPYDTTKNGTIPCSSVLYVFANGGLVLKENEVDELINVYQDGLMKERFKYGPLIKRLASIHVEKDKIDQTLHPEFHDDESQRELYCARSEIREKLHSRRKNAYTVYGNTTDDKMQETDFFNRLANAGICLMKQQREALMKYYSNPFDSMVDWKKFCDDVETSNIITNVE